MKNLLKLVGYIIKIKIFLYKFKHKNIKFIIL